MIMFVKKATQEEKEALFEKFRAQFPDAALEDEAYIREYMLNWLSAFAPDMSYYDAKSFCLPKKLHKNYLWHAFSFQKTDCYMEEDAKEAFSGGFPGKCFLIFNDENIIASLPDGTVLSPEAFEEYKNVVVFNSDISKTYVHTGSEEFGPYFKSTDSEAADEDCGNAEETEI